MKDLMKALVYLFVLCSILQVVKASFEEQFNLDDTSSYTVGEASTSQSISSMKNMRDDAAPRIRSRKKGNELSIESRGELFWDRGGFPEDTCNNEKKYAHHHYNDEKYFAKALNESKEELGKECPEGYFTDEMLKERFMRKVRDYHEYNVSLKRLAKYRREYGLNMTMQEYDALRKHFLNAQPPEGRNEAEKNRIGRSKSRYRASLKDPHCDRDKVLKELRDRGWTEESIKPHVLPAIPVIRKFIHALRAKSKSLGRSNPDVDIDLNQELNYTEDDDILNGEAGAVQDGSTEEF